MFIVEGRKTVSQVEVFVINTIDIAQVIPKTTCNKCYVMKGRQHIPFTDMRY